MKRVGLLLLCILAMEYVMAQDTLSVSFSKVQQDFLSNNLELIAQRYNMDAADALVKQAKLFANPTFSASREAYSGEKKKFFDISNQAEYSLQLQQLFSIAGKRRNQIELAKIGYKVSELSYLDLMRNLKYQLAGTFYQLYFLQQSEQLFDEELSSIASIVKGYQEQKEKGNVAAKDFLRMVALKESLEHQKVEVSAQVVALEHDLNLLLHTSNKVYRLMLDEGWQQQALQVSLPPLGAIIDSASANRPDVQIAQQNLLMAQQNIKMQRSLAVPDVTFGAQYDRVGGPSKKYVGLTASFDLPFFNRNQGNISAAKASANAAQAQLDAQSNRAIEDIASSYQMLTQYQKAIGKSDPTFITSYKSLIDAAKMQYLQHNMSLVEFLDLYDSYKENRLDWNDRWMKYQLAKEELNFQVGASIVK
jgi:Outer membrane protein